ncbi:MAG TPA: hypothetical protein PK762_08820 [Candidatus Kapabacteria bacterium]|nr:hypothetical protein [Candidatus Kapabacteria bacterium]
MKKNIQLKYFCFYLILAFLLTNTNSFSQISNLSISGGLTTTQILGDSPNSAAMIPRDDDSLKNSGGSFNGVQPGFFIMLDIGFGEDIPFSVPLGFEYTMYDGRERIPITMHYTAWFKHTVNVSTLTFGVNYDIVKTSFSKVAIYTGIEGRANFINSGNLYSRIENRKTNEIVINNRKTKDSAFRFGGQIKLGIKGEIIPPLYINSSFGLGIMNLTGRDSKRGELLTPDVLNETKESIIYNSYFSLMLQYKL